MSAANISQFFKVAFFQNQDSKILQSQKLNLMRVKADAEPSNNMSMIFASESCKNFSFRNGAVSNQLTDNRCKGEPTVSLREYRDT
jgi:hypothetical protein